MKDWYTMEELLPEGISTKNPHACKIIKERMLELGYEQRRISVNGRQRRGFLRKGVELPYQKSAVLSNLVSRL